MLPSPSRPLPSSARPSGPSPASLPTRFRARDGGNGAAPQSAASNPVRKCACEGRRDGGRNERRRRRRQRPPSPKSVARFQERNAKLTKLQCNADYECHESPPASMFVNGFRTLRARQLSKRATDGRTARRGLCSSRSLSLHGDLDARCGRAGWSRIGSRGLWRSGRQGTGGTHNANSSHSDLSAERIPSPEGELLRRGTR